MLTLLKIYLNIADETQDTLLKSLLDDATAEFNDITNNPYAGEKEKQKVIIQLAIFHYNRLGIQGITSQSYSSSSESLSDGYPKELNRRLMSFKKLRSA